MAGSRGRYQRDDPDVPIREMEPLRKIFIGGLREETTDETLKEYFGQYGDLSDHVVIKDGEGNSRRFGFVTFTDLSAANNCLNTRPHTLDGKEVEAKRACRKEIIDKIKDVKKAGDKLKIFIGGVRRETTEEMLRDLFDNHPDLSLKCESVSIAKNKETDEPRAKQVPDVPNRGYIVHALVMKMNRDARSPYQELDLRSFTGPVITGDN